jgi:hypothetical protein
MARKLAISNTVTVAANLQVPDAVGGTTLHKFKLVCDRLDGDALRKSMEDESLDVRDFLAGVIKNWEGQRIVLEEDGSPSPFSADALRDLLSIAGVPALLLRAYMTEVVARQKN